MHIRYYLLLIVVFAGNSYAGSDAFNDCSWFYGTFRDSGSEVSGDTKDLNVLRRVSLSSLFQFLSFGKEANDVPGKESNIIIVEDNGHMDVYTQEMPASRRMHLRSIGPNECIGDHVLLISKISAKIGDGFYVPLATKITLDISSINDGSISVVVTEEARQLDFGFIPSTLKTAKSYRFMPFLQTEPSVPGHIN